MPPVTPIWQQSYLGIAVGIICPTESFLLVMMHEIKNTQLDGHSSEQICWVTVILYNLQTEQIDMEINEAH